MIPGSSVQLKTTLVTLELLYLKNPRSVAETARRITPAMQMIRLPKIKRRWLLLFARIRIEVMRKGSVRIIEEI
jgi:hypothetical protein